ncbi:hypothetical protein TVAG_314610 [Trichomonas vaginalis G3]|uniref:DUF3447 domain-containing protein n=1 Tax=Trichomonas vaginalis (strain ATCC PRA-98 / G3) TaxID=412133 RepID=A2ETQ0_TRIV3|nr:hypothetical protein TVAG_314610 [Trichomonas vaginalis G3]|eukprot:XP_001316154.1 hypothetical protein [Trichomonas vaginalis G3]
MKLDYNELMQQNQDTITAMTTLYRLRTLKEQEIIKIFEEIDTKLLKTNTLMPNDIISAIITASKYNNKYFKSYWILFKLFYEKYHPKQIFCISNIFDYFVYKEYGIVFDEFTKGKIDDFESKNYSMDIHEENTIYRAVMNDDKDSFIVFIESEGFDRNQELNSDFYPYRLSLLELCCYHGAVNCFKLLRTKFNSEITRECLQLSFLSGVPDIVNECLKFHEPDYGCMRNAVISHNIDFVTFLTYEHNLEIDYGYSCRYFNLHALFVYLDQIGDINGSFVNSVWFNMPSLCDYFLSHGVDINAKDNRGRTALHLAARINKKEIAEFLILHGANIKGAPVCTFI